MNQNSIKAEFYDSKISSQHFKLRILSKFKPQIQNVKPRDKINSKFTREISH
nr:hypothetical protein [uncultured Campylobacter sp.]